MKCVNCGCDAEVLDRGRTINRCAYVGSQVISLRERIPQLEKQARKTAPKTLAVAQEKIAQAKSQLEKARKELAAFEAEWVNLKECLLEMKAI